MFADDEHPLDREPTSTGSPPPPSEAGMVRPDHPSATELWNALRIGSGVVTEPVAAS